MSIDSTWEPSPTDRFIVALAHPSLDDAVEVFGQEMASEQRYFRTPSPKLGAKSLGALVDAGGVRLGVIVSGRLVAMARVANDGSAVVAVVHDWRGRGVGRELLHHTLSRAAAHGHTRVVFHSSRRSTAFLALAKESGATVIDRGRGRIDLIVDLGNTSQIA